MFATEHEIRYVIEQEWSNDSIKIDWLGLENVIRAIYRCKTITDNQTIVDLVNEAFGAFTKRGRPYD